MKTQNILIFTDGQATDDLLEFAEKYGKGKVTVSEMHSQQFRATVEGLNNVVKEVEEVESG